MALRDDARGDGRTPTRTPASTPPSRVHSKAPAPCRGHTHGVPAQWHACRATRRAAAPPSSRSARRICRCCGLGSAVMRSAGRLTVDVRCNVGEVARFHSHIVCGPTPLACDIWTAAIGADGYGLLSHPRRHRYVRASPPLRPGPRERSRRGRGSGTSSVRQPCMRQDRRRRRGRACRRGFSGRQHGAHGQDAARRWPSCGAPLGQSGSATSTIGGATRSGTQRLGRRCCGGRAAWRSADAVVSLA